MNERKLGRKAGTVGEGAKRKEEQEIIKWVNKLQNWNGGKSKSEKVTR